MSLVPRAGEVLYRDPDATGSSDVAIALVQVWSQHNGEQKYMNVYSYRLRFESGFEILLEVPDQLSFKPYFHIESPCCNVRAKGAFPSRDAFCSACGAKIGSEAPTFPAFDLNSTVTPTVFSEFSQWFRYWYETLVGPLLAELDLHDAETAVSAVAFDRKRFLQGTPR